MIQRDTTETGPNLCASNRREEDEVGAAGNRIIRRLFNTFFLRFLHLFIYLVFLLSFVPPRRVESRVAFCGERIYSVKHEVSIVGCGFVASAAFRVRLIAAHDE